LESATPISGRAGSLEDGECGWMSESNVMKSGLKYRVTTDSGEVFTGTFTKSRSDADPLTTKPKQKGLDIG
jgi:hypothetical protein